MNSRVRHPQTPLALAARSSPSYDNFQPADNALALDLLRGMRQGEHCQVYLWGVRHCGKSHLLLAFQQAALDTGQRAFYLSTPEHLQSPEICDSLESFDAVSLDNIEAVCGHPEWERGLFNLINFSRESGTRLLFAAASSPAALDWKLPDLASRLQWGTVLQLHRLNDSDLQQVLVNGAAQYGMQFDQPAARYLLQRHSRDVNELLALLPLIDQESLAAGRRRITLPFLRHCLALQA